MPGAFGITLPANFWSLDLERKRSILSDIHTAGFDHVYTADHVSFHNGAGSDGFVHSAAVSQLHPTLGVMISIYLLPLRHPLPVARQLATMATVAPGRFIFGIGVGGEDRHEVEVCGVDPATRGKRTNESLEVITGLMRGETVTMTGEHFDIETAKIRPTPESPIPIIVGGRSNAALRRAGRYGDGWIGVWCSPRRYAEALEIIDAAADEAGRRVEWQHGLQPWVGVGSTRERARAWVAEQMEAFYKVPFEAFERYTPYGTPAEVAEYLAAYRDAGCHTFNLKVCCEHPEDEVELGAEIRAALLN